MRELAGDVTPQDEQPYTVDRACDDYMAFLENDGRSEAAIKDARYKINAFIRPTLGAFKVVALTPQQLRKWRADLIKVAPRLRTRKGKTQKHRNTSDERARKATANRILTTLKAVLNHAFAEEKVPSDQAWSRRAQPFGNVAAARVRFLQNAECVRLSNASPSVFLKLRPTAMQSVAPISGPARFD